MKQTVFLYKEASRSLIFVFGGKKKLNCWNGSKTKELANFMLLFTNSCAFDFVSSGPISVQTTWDKRSSVLLPRLPYRARRS